MLTPKSNPFLDTNPPPLTTCPLYPFSSDILGTSRLRCFRCFRLLHFHQFVCLRFISTGLDECSHESFHFGKTPQFIILFGCIPIIVFPSISWWCPLTFKSFFRPSFWPTTIQFFSGRAGINLSICQRCLWSRFGSFLWGRLLLLATLLGCEGSLIFGFCDRLGSSCVFEKKIVFGDN